MLFLFLKLDIIELILILFNFKFKNSLKSPLLFYNSYQFLKLNVLSIYIQIIENFKITLFSIYN